MVALTNNVRIRIPTTATRFEPFFVAGGGVAHLRHTADFVFTPPVPPIPIPVPVPRTIAQHLTASEVALALTLGGGVGVRVGRRASVDADLRLLRLLGDEDRNVGRFGVMGRYRF
jgi:hypothetical protein